MCKVAIVGITGDPPTIGHAWLVKTALQTNLFDRIWLMPCYKHRLGKDPVDPWHRFRMCEILAEEIQGPVSASAWEMMLKLDGSSFITHSHLRQFYKNWKFTWVIGMDNVLSIDKWAYSKEIKRGHLPFLVCNRGGITIPRGDCWFLHEPHHYVTGEDCVTVSSSEFRQYYKAGDDRYREIVTPGVLAYIEQQGLYR